MSRTGLILCSIYILTTALCLALAWTAQAIVDGKSFMVFAQLPLAFQQEVLASIGLADVIAEWDWITAYVVVGSSTLVALYALGWSLARYLIWGLRQLR